MVYRTVSGLKKYRSDFQCRNKKGYGTSKSSRISQEKEIDLGSNERDCESHRRKNRESGWKGGKEAKSIMTGRLGQQVLGKPGRNTEMPGEALKDEDEDAVNAF